MRRLQSNPSPTSACSIRSYERMSGFMDMVAQDNASVFLNAAEFAELRTVIYDGDTFPDIPIVLSGLKERSGRRESDLAQGLYLVTAVLHCRIEDLGGKQPEKGTRIRISGKSSGAFFDEFYVAASVCELGMLRVEMEAIDE